MTEKNLNEVSVDFLLDMEHDNIRMYILGTATELERKRIDEGIFQGNQVGAAWQQAIAVVEGQLIESYVDGSLAQREEEVMRRLENSSEAFKRKVVAERTLQEMMNIGNA